MVSWGVGKRPDVPVMPLGEDVHEVLFLEDQVIVVLRPDSTIDGVAEIETVVVGAAPELKLDTEPPPQAASMKLKEIIADIPTLVFKLSFLMISPSLPQ